MNCTYINYTQVHIFILHIKELYIAYKRTHSRYYIQRSHKIVFTTYNTQYSMYITDVYVTPEE